MSGFDLRRFIDRPDWINDAACRDEDTNLFFPAVSEPGTRNGPGAAAREQIRRAKAICRRCDVQGTCLAFAMETGEAYGVWGGLDEIERWELRRRDSRRARGIRPLSFGILAPSGAA